MDWRWLAWQLYDGEIWRPAAAAYDSLLQSQWASDGQIRQLQAERLADTLRFALNAVPFYRELGLPPRLEAFPVISRQTLRAESRRLRAEGITGRITEWHTGGSSGEPVAVFVDAPAQALRRAALLRGDLWGSTLRPTDAQAGLWASRRDSGKLKGLRARLYDKLFNRFIYSCFEMNAERAAELNRCFRREQPGLLYGPTTAIQAFMHFGRQAGIQPWRFQKVIPCGERCSLDDAAELESFFGSFVTDRYASNEMGPIASRCEHRTWHVNSEMHYLEVLREDGSIADHGRGRLLCTSLVTRALPLIRYDIGDFVDLTAVDCPCGRGLQTFTSMEGRVSDQVKCPDGRWINLCTFNSYFQHLPLRKYRFIIEDETRLSFLLQADETISSGEMAALREHFDQHLAGHFEYEIRQVESIPSLPNGKNPYVVNEVHNRRVNPQAQSS